MQLNAQNNLPIDGTAGALAARIWRPDVAGPSVVALRGRDVIDISQSFPTMRDLCEATEPAQALQRASGERVASIDELFTNTSADTRDPTRPWLLAPVDLQVIKAAGVTFAISMLERVIEEKARGNPAAAAAIRTQIVTLVGDDLSKLKPGSAPAMALKDVLIAQGVWSQYLEVGIGPDAEIFTKAAPMSAVGSGDYAGLHPSSSWNNPEPEMVLAVNSRGQIVGATLGNDVNLRDIEGRSALLLGKAKDNNAAAAIGPVLRFFDASFSLADVRQTTISLNISGTDGFTLDGVSQMSQISRDPLELVAQMMGTHHQYPDGAMLFLGCGFAPVKDRHSVGGGFTHVDGDTVSISAPKLGTLVNRMKRSDQCPPWTFGTSHLMRNLAQRGLLDGRS